MGSSNRAVWRMLGFSSHRDSETVCSIPHPHLEGRTLYFMADPAHVLKNYRAQLLRSTCFYLSDVTVRQHNLPGNKIDINDVQAVLDHDSENDLKIANGLSAVHVKDGHFTKMKVSVAVQLFREAPPAIRYLIKQGKLPVEAETTAWFFDLLRKWHNLMSSRHPVLALSKADISKYEDAVGILHLAQDTVRNMKMGTTSHWKPSQAGLLISTSVVLSLSEELLNRYSYKYVLTGRLNQDCLENIFSVVRLKKPVPNAYDMKCALKLICVGQFLHTPKSTSYDIDDSLHLVDLLDPDFKTKPLDFRGDEEHLEDLFLEDISSVECDILAFFGGFLLKAVLKVAGNCNLCKEALLDDGNGSHNTLIDLKEYVKGASNLIRPSDSVMTVLVQYEERFKGFATADAILDLKAPFRSISRFLAENVDVRLGVCEQHEKKVEKLFLERYVRSRLRMHLRQQKAQSVEGHSSKTCAGVNLA
uniref:Putative tick transposon n=1 Tax=Ixodes ricinus TaxID=34613 RepID=A0A147BN90_IXORI